MASLRSSSRLRHKAFCAPFMDLCIHNLNLVSLWQTGLFVCHKEPYMWAQGCLTIPTPPLPLLHLPQLLAPSLLSLKPPSSRGQGTRLFLSPPIRAGIHPQPPSAHPLCCISSAICVPCLCTYASCLVWDIWPWLWPPLSLAHTPVHLRAPRVPPLLLQVKHQSPVWLCSCCLSQSRQSSTLCLFLLHCADLYWFNIHSCFTVPPCWVYPAALSGNGNVSRVVCRGWSAHLMHQKDVLLTRRTYVADFIFLQFYIFDYFFHLEEEKKTLWGEKHGDIFCKHYCSSRLLPQKCGFCHMLTVPTPF